MNVIKTDIEGSPTYGKHLSIELTEDNHRQIFVPRGFAHGFVVLSEEVILQYKCDDFFNKESEGAILWNDSELNIDCKIPLDKIILSDKDITNHLFDNFETPFNITDNLY